MGSTFGSYGIAVSGMFVNQSALAVTSSNLANINTTGNSRKQTVTLEKVTVQTGGTSVGSGSDLEEIKRARSSFLDRAYRQQNAKLSYWTTKTANIEDIQLILNEFAVDDGSADDGLQSTIENFFSSWEELAKDPSSLTSRQTVLDYANTLVDILAEVDGQLEQLQADACAKVTEGVADLNSLAQKVADLNSQIMKAEVSGVEAGDLRDQRDSLIDEMSALVNISVSEQSSGMLDVSIGGVPLVKGSHTYSLEAAGDGSAQRPLTVSWPDFACAADITSGSLAAYLEDADQSGVTAIDLTTPYNFTTGLTSSISNMRQGLNDLITTIATEVNALHSAGTGLDGTTGVAFFVAADATKPLSINNIAVNPVLAEDLNGIAAGSGGEAGDNTVANAITALTDAKAYTYNGLEMDITGFYQALVSWAATEGESAAGFYDSQSALCLSVDNQRQSLSAVSVDEEMAKMITYQNAYSAAARVLSTIDGLIAGLIQELG